MMNFSWSIKGYMGGALRLVAAATLLFLYFMFGIDLRAHATILFDSASVSEVSYELDAGKEAVGLTLLVDGVRLPGRWSDGKTSVSFDIIKIGSTNLGVAIAISTNVIGQALPAGRKVTPAVVSESRIILSAIDGDTRTVKDQIRGLEDIYPLLATICATLDDRASIAAMIASVRVDVRQLLDKTFEGSMVELASNCRQALKATGVHSDGFISRRDVSNRVAVSFDGLLSTDRIIFANWQGNLRGSDMSGAVVTLRGLEILEPGLSFSSLSIVERSLLWDGKIWDFRSQRTAFFGRISQYPGAATGLFDAADELTADLTVASPKPGALQTAISKSSRESLLLVEHVLVNLRLLRILALEEGPDNKIFVRSRLSETATEYWYQAAFAVDASESLEAVRSELFRRSFERSADAVSLQNALKSWGFYLGEVDGKAGPRTRAALSEFERIVSGAANGALSPREIVALKIAPTSVVQDAAVIPGSIADWLKPAALQSRVFAEKKRVASEVAGLKSQIAEVAKEITELERGFRLRILGLERELEACICQYGRACP